MTWQEERDLLGPPIDEESQEGFHRADGDSEDAGKEPDEGSDLASQILPDAASLSAQRDEYLAALQRTQADFANYRKRVLRQQEEQADRAASELVMKVLPVLDTLDLAETHLDNQGVGEDSTRAESTEAQVLRQARALLMGTLHKEGLERIDAVGVPFDPAVHDAVAHAAADTADESAGATIDEVMRAGYRWRGQTLRPAMVRVRG